MCTDFQNFSMMLWLNWDIWQKMENILELFLFNNAVLMQFILHSFKNKVLFFITLQLMYNKTKKLVVIRSRLILGYLTEIIQEILWTNYSFEIYLGAYLLESICNRRARKTGASFWQSALRI